MKHKHNSNYTNAREEDKKYCVCGMQLTPADIKLGFKNCSHCAFVLTQRGLE